jgi:hypothetical protein
VPATTREGLAHPIGHVGANVDVWVHQRTVMEEIQGRHHDDPSPGSRKVWSW